MISFNIYWNDLTEYAKKSITEFCKEKGADITDNIWDVIPMATVDIEEDDYADQI